MKLKVRSYLWMLLGIPFLAMALVIAASAWIRLDDARRVAYESARKIAGKAAQAYLESGSAMQRLARTPAVLKSAAAGFCDKSWDADWLEAARKASVLSRFAVFSADGLPLCSDDSFGFKLQIQLLEANIFKQAASLAPPTQPRLWGPFESRGEEAFISLAPVISADGTRLGFLAAFMPTRRLFDLSESTQEWGRPSIRFDYPRPGVSPSPGVSSSPSEAPSMPALSVFETEIPTPPIAPPAPEASDILAIQGFLSAVDHFSGEAFASTATIAADASVTVSLPPEAAYAPVRDAILFQTIIFVLFAAVSAWFGMRLAARFERAASSLLGAASGEASPQTHRAARTGIMEIDHGISQMAKWRILRENSAREAALWQLAADESSSGLAVMSFSSKDDTPYVLLANPVFLNLTGWTNFCPGMRLFSMGSGSILSDEVAEKELVASMRCNYGAEREIQGVDASGRFIHIRATLSPMPRGEFDFPDDEGDPRSLFVLTLDDTTEIIDRENQLAKQATTDALTGLPNRQLFTDRLVQILEIADRTAQTAAVALVDIDRFKMVNDSLGHAAGDEIIQIAAARISGRMRQGDTLCRLGGDEFGIVVGGGGVSFEDLSFFIERVRQAFDEPFLLHGQEFALTCSMGVALFPEDGSDPGTLVKRADLAMFRAKEDGGGGAQFFSHEMRVAFEERMTLEMELKGAIKRGEIQLHYQPKVRAGGGQPAGMEALARWHHPQMGWVPPSKFIPLAEESGIISIIGREAMRQAIRDAKHLWDLGFRNMPVAVNVSARQISKAFLLDIQSMLQEAGLPPRMLHAEITESLIMPDSDEAAIFLNGLSDIGIEIALDDFGTGWSSLAILKTLPLDHLKMDKSFVDGLGSETDDEAIAKAIISMAHSLGHKVVAEGVETDLQLRLLVELGADVVQGYFVCKPMPIQNVVDWLEAGCPFAGRS